MFDFSGIRTINVGGNSLFVYSVDKQDELFKMNFEGLDMFFNTLDTLGKDGIGHAMVLMDGFNDTTDELHEIPQVRKFVKELFKRYPHVLNYINFELEGHKYLLASLLDVRTIMKGRRMTFEEHAKKYGYGTPMPQYNMVLDLDKNLLAEIIKAMFVHGNSLGVTKYADKQVAKLMSIWGL